MVHGIVSSLCGDITIYSEPDKGTTFHIYLPVLEDAKLTLQEADTAPIPTGNERIILVDDDEGLVQMQRRMLERLGYNVSAMTSSVDALVTFQKTPDDFDPVITDMTMPMLTGANLARQILAIRSDMLIILCTGYSELIDSEKAKTIGIRGYVMKPVILKDLAKVVRNVLDGF